MLNKMHVFANSVSGDIDMLVKKSVFIKNSSP